MGGGGGGDSRYAAPRRSDPQCARRFAKLLSKPVASLCSHFDEKMSTSRFEGKKKPKKNNLTGVTTPAADVYNRRLASCSSRLQTSLENKLPFPTSDAAAMDTHTHWEAAEDFPDFRFQS